MKKPDSWGEFRKEWWRFLRIVFDPWVLSLAAVTGLLAYWSLNQSAKIPDTVGAVLTVMLALVAAVLGARALRVFEQIAEGGALAARGQGAVRSLMVLLRSIASLDRRLKAFRDDKAEIEKNPALIRRSYDEASNICLQLQEQTVKAIEDWKDLVTEADLPTLIGEISARATELQDARALLEQAQHRAEAAEARERKQLEAAVAARAKDAARLEKEVEKLVAQFTGTEATIANGITLRDLLVGGESAGYLASRQRDNETLRLSSSPPTARTKPTAAGSGPAVKTPESGKPSR